MRRCVKEVIYTQLAIHSHVMYGIDRCKLSLNGIKVVCVLHLGCVDSLILGTAASWVSK